MMRYVIEFLGKKKSKGYLRFSPTLKQKLFSLASAHLATTFKISDAKGSDLQSIPADLGTSVVQLILLSSPFELMRPKLQYMIDLVL